MTTTRSLRRTIAQLAFVAASTFPIVGLAASAAGASPEDETIDVTPDEGPELSVEGYDTEEGDPGDQVSLPFIVTASHAADTDITFRFHTGAVGFGAVPGEDFEPVDDHFVLPAGETAIILTVPIVPDDVVNDHDGLVIAWIADPSTGTIGTSTAVAGILDDDLPGEDGPNGQEPVDDGDPDEPGTSDDNNPVPDDDTAAEPAAAEPEGDEPVVDPSAGDELALASGDRAADAPGPDLTVPVLGGVLAAVVAAIGFVVAHLRRSASRL